MHLHRIFASATVQKSRVSVALTFSSLSSLWGGLLTYPGPGWRWLFLTLAHSQILQGEGLLCLWDHWWRTTEAESAPLIIYLNQVKTPILHSIATEFTIVLHFSFFFNMQSVFFLPTEFYGKLKSNQIQAEPAEVHFSGFELRKKYCNFFVRKIGPVFDAKTLCYCYYGSVIHFHNQSIRG